jgi:hypothetical protein
MPAERQDVARTEGGPFAPLAREVLRQPEVMGQLPDWFNSDGPKSAPHFGSALGAADAEDALASTVAFLMEAGLCLGLVTGYLGGVAARWGGLPDSWSGLLDRAADAKYATAVTLASDFTRATPPGGVQYRDRPRCTCGRHPPAMVMTSPTRHDEITYHMHPQDPLRPFGHRCAYPRCPSRLVEDPSGTLVGEVCHIKGKSSGRGSHRHDPSQTDEERHGVGNLIALCGTHHRVIDDDEEAYTVERGADSATGNSIAHVLGSIGSRRHRFS